MDSYSGNTRRSDHHADKLLKSIQELATHLPNNWDLWAVDPPGHGGVKGIAIDNLERLIMEYIHHIPWDEFDCIVLFGHSLGGYIVAFQK